MFIFITIFFLPKFNKFLRIFIEGETSSRGFIFIEEIFEKKYISPNDFLIFISRLKSKILEAFQNRPLFRRKRPCLTQMSFPQAIFSCLQFFHCNSRGVHA